MAVLPVSLNEMLRPWWFAGITHFWPDPDAPELDPEIEILLRSGPASVGAPSPARPIAPAATGSAPRSEERTPEQRPSPSRAVAPQAPQRQAQPCRAAAPLRPAPAALTPTRQARLDRTPGAPILWTYPELGVDLEGNGDPARSARLRELIGALHLPKGTSCFWPLRLPDEQPEDAAGQFQAGLERLNPRAVILFGVEAILQSGLPLADLTTPFTQSLHAGRVFLLLPGMDRLTADPGLSSPSAVFLSAQFSGLPGIIPVQR